MIETLESIRDGLRRNSFINEASVSQGIVLRLLRELGWDTFDVDQVSPEYSVKGRRVDYALCHPRRKPRIFVEVKQVSKSALDFEEQLAAYAYEEGVPLVVLTTGKEWNFYVPYGPGKFVDRRVYRIDLLERSPDEIVSRFQRYLDFDAVRNGNAFVNAQNDLRDVLSVQETKRALPKAWTRLLEEPSPGLVELVLQQLESMTGDLPQAGVLEDFLRRQANGLGPTPESEDTRPPRGNPHPPKPEPVGPTVPTPGPEVNFIPVGNVPLTFLGQRMSFPTHRRRLVKAFEFLSERDSEFLEKFSRLAIPGKRPGVARRPVDLFPGKESLAKTRSHFTELGNGSGWYIDLNQSADTMAKMIKRACDVAGLRFGIDVRLECD
jgi:predicted type IV restriction endonuclease